MSAILFTVALVGLASIARMAATNVAARPGTVDPFELPDVADPSADTLSEGDNQVKTVFVPSSWQSTKLTSLTRVGDLLDSLEAHGVREREVVSLSESSFLVRWR